MTGEVELVELWDKRQYSHRRSGEERSMIDTPKESLKIWGCYGGRGQGNRPSNSIDVGDLLACREPSHTAWFRGLRGEGHVGSPETLET